MNENNNFIKLISNDFINNLNKTFNKITINYNKIYSKIPELLNSYSLPFNNIIDLDTALNELSIQIQSILFIIEKEESNVESNVENNVENNVESNVESNVDIFNEIKKDKLVNTTITKMLPLFFYYLMLFDNESIINSKTFGESIKRNKNNLNGQPNLDILDTLGTLDTLDTVNKYSDISNLNMPFIELD